METAAHPYGAGDASEERPAVSDRDGAWMARVNSLHLEMEHVQPSMMIDLINTPRRLRKPGLLSAAEASELCADLVADRPFITGGYRRPASMRQCALSALSLHNETGNIWTHLLGASAFLALLVMQGTAVSLHTECRMAPADRAVLAMYLFGAIFCLGASATFHTFCCCSPEAFHGCKQLDHMGVLGLLGASDMPMIYFGFYSHPRLQALYMALVALCLLMATFALLSPRLRHPRFMPVRLSIFIALVAVGWTHMAHEISLKGGLSTAEGRVSLWCWVTPFSAYLTGLVFLVSRLPERLKPGAFNIWWRSALLYLRISKGLPVE
eukprot:jgi/Tetstr1/447893/TSEL_035202.t1